MTPLKTYRRQLGSLLAEALGGSSVPLGAQVNPPAVVVNPGSEYLTFLDYRRDDVTFAVAVLSKPGDPAAVMDALDDMVDQVRLALKGTEFKFISVSGLTAYGDGVKDWPAVIATVGLERSIC